MATPRKITSFFNPITNPAGAATSPLASYFAAAKAPAVSPFQNQAAVSPFQNRAPVSPAVIDLARPPSGPMTPIPAADRARIAAVPPPAPVLPVQGAVNTPPIFQGSSPSQSPIVSQGATGATPQVPPTWLNPDGSFKTPDEIAQGVAGALESAHSNGDVGTLALGQFASNNESAGQLQADARRIGNTRNDIAVGDTDPYKVASDSGVAYTAAELNAIENAYAGIYDPALDTALSKAQAKQDADNAAAAAEAKNNEPFTLGKDQVRYDAQGNPIAVGISSDDAGAAGGAYTPGANSVVDAYVSGFKNGTYKAADIPEQYRDLVAQGVAQGKSASPVSKSSLDAISNINALLGSNALGSVTGLDTIFNPLIFAPGAGEAPLLNYAKQLAGILKLENRNTLHGQGQISDFEFRVLGDASNALGIKDNGTSNLSEEDFKKELTKLKVKLEVGETNLTDQELMKLFNGDPANGIEAMTPDEIREYSDYRQGKPSFSSAGNASASTGTGNRPQRNNNPGNVKAGGLSDSLAVGQDEQGHLIFPDAATGFKAMTADLTAKINGSSRYLPANPTIAQLGKVYAEDPNWPKKVAQILGVPVDTHTKNVPLANLVKAVATQEGFYA